MFRSIFVIAAASVVATFVVACGTEPDTALPTYQAAEGTCYVRETAEEMLSLSNVSPWINCEYPHQLEVYGFGVLPDDLLNQPDRPSNALERLQASDVCPWDGIRGYLGAREFDYQYGISVWAKYPTQKEWAGGLRTVVCSLGVQDPLQPESRPEFTGSLRNIMGRTISDGIRLCRSGEKQTVCSRPHDAEMTGSIPVPNGDAQVRLDAAYRACQPVIDQYTAGQRPDDFVIKPLVGETSADCWYGPATGTVIGSVRGGLR
ncbi:septum formation family protein [Rhodococcus sp. BE178]|uniref:septum formation family protein n=1 Tax=Rhodococcus sp. BE178 TaxID=2817737 RepID=UPI003D1AE122